MEKNKVVLKYCPECKTESILVATLQRSTGVNIYKPNDPCLLTNQELVKCQNLNCHSLFRKKDYLEFLESWEKLDHSLDEQYDKLVEKGKKFGFDSPDTSELFHLDAVAYSFDSGSESREEQKRDLKEV